MTGRILAFIFALACCVAIFTGYKTADYWQVGWATFGLGVAVYLIEELK